MELVAVSDTMEAHCLFCDKKLTVTMIERKNFESIIMHFRKK